MISLVIIFLLFLVLDLIFFWVNQAFLTKTLVSVQGFKPNVRYVSAFFCYVALTFLMYYFIILPKCIPFYEIFGIYNKPLINEKNGFIFTLTIMNRLLKASNYLEKTYDLTNLDLKLSIIRNFK
jgi:hypothetical protein